MGPTTAHLTLTLQDNHMKIWILHGPHVCMETGFAGSASACIRAILYAHPASAVALARNDRVGRLCPRSLKHAQVFAVSHWAVKGRQPVVYKSKTESGES